MAKTTERQKIIIDFYQNQLEFWKKTNDLSSPTHRGDIEEYLWDLDFSPKEKEEIMNNCIKLLTSIRKA